jgi:RNA polymerase sigma-B factor
MGASPPRFTPESRSWPESHRWKVGGARPPVVPITIPTNSREVPSLRRCEVVSVQLEAQRPLRSAVEAGRPNLADFAEYRRTGDRGLRDRLVGAHVGLAYKGARRLSGRGVELEDLRQVALIALVHAVERFDPSRGFAFTPFATPTIIGSLKRHLRDRAWAVRPPRSVQERLLAVAAVTERLTGDLHRAPTVAEIADDGEWSVDDVREALDGQRRRFPLHWRVTEDDGVIEPIADDLDFSAVENRLVIDDLFEVLHERERAIVRMRYFEELGQKEIGQRIGVSQMHVCRLLNRSLEQLQAAAVDPGSNIKRLEMTER